jgi:rhodanese-related sulfurtransferase
MLDQAQGAASGRPGNARATNRMTTTRGNIAMTTELPSAKQTALGLYITAREAYEKWQADPDNILILDVRTPEEHLFVGHPTMAWKIPVISQSYEWDSQQGKFPMVFLSDFVARVSEAISPDKTVMVMCRSGGRSAIAINLLAQAGFQNVYNIIDGMEGDVNGDSESVTASDQPASGWKNSGCPWTKQLTPERTVLPSSRS